MNDFSVGFVGIVFAAICIFVSITLGKEMGQQEACKLVQLEWVKDKCMKVTREAV